MSLSSETLEKIFKDQDETPGELETISQEKLKEITANQCFEVDFWHNAFPEG